MQCKSFHPCTVLAALLASGHVLDSATSPVDHLTDEMHNMPCWFSSGLDYLSSPTGPILEAQQAAATAFGADQTWFLVNGCSVGIHAAIMASCSPGQTLILARNSHMSAFSGCVLAGCKPLWLQPELDPVHGVPHCPTPRALAEAFQQAWEQGLDVGAVFVVSPTYFGVAGKIAGG